MRADHVSLYGYARRTTPNIDRWAHRGVVFENAISATSWTLASHASMFTGLLPHQHGANWDLPLDPSWWTLAEVLRSRGYETAGFTSNFDYGGVGWGLGNGFERYDADSVSLRHNLKSLFLGRSLLQSIYEQYEQPDDLDRTSASQINRDVLRWFHRRSSQPYYLFINYFDVHEPYLAPADAASSFGSVSPWVVGRINSAVRQKNHRLQLAAGDSEALITGYDNCLESLDSSVGELLDSLSHLAGWGNSIVIITSDHGEGFGEHGTYSHGYNLYREVLHAPLAIVGPHIPSGMRISRVVQTRKLFATVLQLNGMRNTPFERAGLERYWMPGFEPGGKGEYAVSELSVRWNSVPMISLTTSEWQYLRDGHGNEELYHWVSDPGERFNVAKSPENQGILRDLDFRLRASVNESLRPWEGEGYLSALDGPRYALADVAAAATKRYVSSVRRATTHIGSSQAFFPTRASQLARGPSSADEELPHSLPYQ